MGETKTAKTNDLLIKVAVILGAVTLVVVIVVLLISRGTQATSSQARNILESNRNLQARQDCARGINSTTQSLRDEAARASRSGDLKLRQLFVAGVRNPTDLVTINVLNDGIDYTNAVQTGAEAALVARLKPPQGMTDAKRVEKTCPRA